MISRCLRPGFFALCLFALTAFCARAKEPIYVPPFPEERQAWETIAARFNEGLTITKGRGVVELALKGLKSKAGDAGTASIRVDEASGHVIEVVANGANFTDAEFAIFAKLPELRALTLWHNG